MWMRTLLSVLPLLCATSLLAATDFNINLNTPLGSHCGEGDPVCGGWTPGQEFDATANTHTSTEGFSFGCLFGGGEEGCERDPDMELDPGCCSQDVFGLTFSFFADARGGGIFPFVNRSGQHWDDLLIVTAFDPNLTYNCGTLAFEFCGFRQDGDRLDILFSGGPGIDSAAVPEPTFWTMLASLGAFVVFGRGRRTS